MFATAAQSQCKIMFLNSVTTACARADGLSASNYYFVRFVVRMLFYDTKGMKIQMVSKTKIQRATNNQKELKSTYWTSENFRMKKTFKVGIL